MIAGTIAPRLHMSTPRDAQCREDADVMLQTLAIRPGDVCLTIASAGASTLATQGKGPQRAIEEVP